NLIDENETLKKEVDRLKHEKAARLKEELKSELKPVNGIRFLAKKVDADANGMKDLAYQLGGEVDNLFLLLATEQNGKALLTCYISKNLTQKKELDAGKIVREMGRLIQGGGGGQSFFATAGGKKPEGIPMVLETVEEYIQ